MFLWPIILLVRAFGTAVLGGCACGAEEAMGGNRVRKRFFTSWLSIGSSAADFGRFDRLSQVAMRCLRTIIPTPCWPCMG